MSQGIQDIEQELRSEQRMAFFRRMALPAAVIALLILMSVAVSVFWKQYQENKYQDTAKEFQSIIAQASKDNNLSLYDKTTTLPEPYGQIGLLMKANKMDSSTPLADRLKVLDDVIALPNGNAYFKASAQIHRVLLQFDTAPVEQIIADLKKMTVGDFPFLSTAQELLAYAYLKAGQKENAVQTLKDINKSSKNSPQIARITGLVNRLSYEEEKPAVDIETDKTKAEKAPSSAPADKK